MVGILATTTPNGQTHASCEDLGLLSQIVARPEMGYGSRSVAVDGREGFVTPVACPARRRKRKEEKKELDLDLIGVD